MFICYCFSSLLSPPLIYRSLDRERQDVYRFLVVATDGGRYDARSATVPVQININDINDNRPTFERYPFRAQVPALIQPGQVLLQVTAFDRDADQNGEILYTLSDHDEPSIRGKFRINPNTGVVSATQSLASEAGRVIHIELTARDKGNPALSSRGLIELRIGEVPLGTAALRFQNDTYRLKLNENTVSGSIVLQVNAVRSDGRRSKLEYFFGAGNENGAFAIEMGTGEIRVADAQQLDYERYNFMDNYNNGQMVIKGSRTVSNDLLLAGSGKNLLGNSLSNYRGRALIYSDDNLFPTNRSTALNSTNNDSNNQNIADRNASSIKEQFVANAQEEEARGEDSASWQRQQRNLKRREMDSLPVFLASNSIQPPELHLMLVARGDVHPATGNALYAYADLIVELEDSNDNDPVFTQSQYAAAVWEGKSKGTFVVQVSACDADSGSNSRLLYHIVDGNHDNAFVIEPAFSGIVKTNTVLDREIRDVYKLKVIATDEGVPQMTGTATIRVHVVDVNDNQPTFPPHNIITVSESKFHKIL